jgi:DNA-binding response OmpR family regulator
MLQPGSYRVAFVEPDAPQIASLRQLLEFEGITVSTADAGDLPRVTHLQADVVILNQVRLRRSTHAIAAEIGRLQARPLLLALVSRGDELSGIELVERGLDAFIAMPCGSREFVARIRAMLRRVRVPAATMPELSAGPGGPTVRSRELDIDPARRRVRIKGRELRLTEQEFQLLYFLAGHPGRVFDRQALLAAVWGSHTFVTARSVDALVKRLRHQLRTAVRGPSFVETVRGVGYRLVERGGGAGVSAA